MSDEEKYAAQGRVYAELKHANANVATLLESLGKCARDLETVANELQQHLSNPADPASGATLQQKLRSISTEQIANRVGELDADRQKAALLQQRVDRF